MDWGCWGLAMGKFVFNIIISGRNEGQKFFQSYLRLKNAYVVYLIYLNTYLGYYIRVGAGFCFVYKKVCFHICEPLQQNIPLENFKFNPEGQFKN